MTQKQHADQDDLAGIVAIFFKRKKLFIVSLLFLWLLSFLYAFLVYKVPAPKYLFSQRVVSANYIDPVLGKVVSVTPPNVLVSRLNNYLIPQVNSPLSGAAAVLLPGKRSIALRAYGAGAQGSAFKVFADKLIALLAESESWDVKAQQMQFVEQADYLKSNIAETLAQIKSVRERVDDANHIVEQITPLSSGAKREGSKLLSEMLVESEASQALSSAQALLQSSLSREVDLHHQLVVMEQSLSSMQQASLSGRAVLTPYHEYAQSSKLERFVVLLVLSLFLSIILVLAYEVLLGFGWGSKG